MLSLDEIRADIEMEDDCGSDMEDDYLSYHGSDIDPSFDGIPPITNPSFKATGYIFQNELCL